jgi:hypothetical protein
LKQPGIEIKESKVGRPGFVGIEIYGTDAEISTGKIEETVQVCTNPGHPPVTI